MSKSLGQIAFEAYHASPKIKPWTWEQAVNKDEWERVGLAIRERGTQMSEKNEPELLPCPFCGDTPAEVDVVALTEPNERGKALFKVECDGCAVRTTWYRVRGQAIEAWNTRVKQ